MNAAIDSTERELLLSSVTDVLGTMFFTEATQQADSSPFHDLDCVAASAEFHGDRQGCLSLSISRGCLRRLASSFLGTDTEDDATEEELKQVLCELVNMICGSFLSRTDREGDFLIRTPQCRESIPALAQAGAIQHFDVEGGSMQVRFAWTEGN